MNSKVTDEGIADALGPLQWCSDSPNDDPESRTFTQALRAWLAQQRLLSQGQWIGYCRDADGTPKVAMVTGSSAWISGRWFNLSQGIRKAIQDLENGMTAALAERYVPEAARDLCRAAVQHLSMPGMR
eukprot:9357595-Alexandrium_andersonii.AAC.1